jgi:hypothetical protein
VFSIASFQTTMSSATGLFSIGWPLIELHFSMEVSYILFLISFC